MAKNNSFPSAAAFLPKVRTLPNLKHASRACKGCDLYLRATQTVFGEGTKKARVMLVGEQPGDKEDFDGRPFVGPAGRILDEALAAAGIDRSEVYVTNAVKHFSWTPDERGKRRIHKKPRYSEIQACRPWLDAEIHAVRPEVIVCMGATAAQALLGKDFSVLRQRGTFVPSDFGALCYGHRASLVDFAGTRRSPRADAGLHSRPHPHRQADWQAPQSRMKS